ncbi:runt domain protein [Dictyocaulus viviparus]|uniref:Runt domain protein n=1 Tax=Dictyocaulus viviparus TaxID=29172 RepID=A0A0D8YB68_DICVI|nr:runt domain protein [Dictyocaulus viviparus]
MSVYHNVHEFLRNNRTPLLKSSSPNIFLTKLPEHHRSNKSLPSPFTVLITSPVPDGTIEKFNQQGYVEVLKQVIAVCPGVPANMNDDTKFLNPIRSTFEAFAVRRVGQQAVMEWNPALSGDYCQL